MAEYRRFISYIYQYDDNKKGVNAGFAKVEVRGGNCRMVIHIRGVFLGQNEICQIYGLTEKNAKFLGIPIGECRPINGIVEQKLVMSQNNIGDTPYSFEDISGIFIDTGRSKVYATSWGEKEFVVSRFASISKDESKEREEVSEILGQRNEWEEIREENGIQQERSTEESRDEIGKIEELVLKAAQLSKKSTEHAKEELETDAEDRRETTSEIKESPRETKELGLEGQMQEKEIEVERIEQESEELFSDAKEEESELESDKILTSTWEDGLLGRRKKKVCHYRGGTVTECGQMESAFLKENPPLLNDVMGLLEDRVGMPIIKSQEKNTCNCGQRHTSEIDSIELRWERLKISYRQVWPFSEHTKADCIQVEPNDLVQLRKDEWKVGNNSFLLHGYFNFHHLIMGRFLDGSNPSFFLGVPGTYEEEEERMAQMFDFPIFVPIDRKKEKKPEYGYWCRMLD